MRGSVLLVSFHFPPENHSGAARPYRFYKYLRKLGYDVQVLTASRQEERHPHENVICVPCDAEERRSGVLRSLAPRLLSRWAAPRSVSWAIAAEQAAGHILTRRKNLVVFSTSPPVVSDIVGGRLKVRFGVPWIADFRDPLTGNPFRRGPGIRPLLDTLVEGWEFHHADALIANTDATLDMWVKRYPKHAGKMHLIWNGFDPEDTVEAKPIPEREFRLLVHAGTVYGIRHPGILLSSLYRSIQHGLLAPRSFRIRMIGLLQEGWARDPTLVEKLVRLGCLQYDGRLLPKREAGEAVATADSLVLLDSHAPSGAVQVPAKLFEYVRVGRPILAITTRNSPTDRLLDRSGVLYTCIYPDDTAEQIDQKVLNFLRLPTEPLRARSWFWETFSAVAQTRELEELMAPFWCRRATRTMDSCEQAWGS